MTEPLIYRLSFFVGIFSCICIWENLSPRRKLNFSKKTRWLNNIAIIFLDSLVVKILLPITAMGAAAYANENKIGLFNLIEVPFALKVLLSLVILDLIIYFQHRLFHTQSFLWRFHRVHHADLDFDVTTALRFHPVEIILSMLIKIAIIFMIGAPVLSILLFEIILNATAMFNHGNIYLPEKIDKVLRFFIVTPDMHRIHHSAIEEETNSNYGFNMPWWDKLFSTYIANPKEGQKKLCIGLNYFRELKYLRLDWLLKIPFIESKPKPESKVV